MSTGEYDPAKLWRACAAYRESEETGAVAAHVEVIEFLAARGLVEVHRDLYGVVPDSSEFLPEIERWLEGSFRLACSLFDAQGRLAGMQARRLTPGDPKVLSPRGWRVRGGVFANQAGRDFLSGSAGNVSRVLVGEGLTDYLALAHVSSDPILCVPGANRVTDLLDERFATVECVLALDRDETGVVAASRASERLTELGHERVHELVWPFDCNDACDALQAIGRNDFAEMIAQVFESPLDESSVPLSNGILRPVTVAVPAGIEGRLSRSSSLEDLEALGEAPDPQDVRRFLLDLLEQSDGSKSSIACLREGALSCLRGRVQSPARLFDAVAEEFLAVVRSEAAENPWISVGGEEDDPWPEPVDPDALFEALHGYIVDHMSMANHAAFAVALWILHAHTAVSAFISPRLTITSPEKRCGKTRLLDIIERLVPKPLLAANITPAALYRSIDCFRPTLLVDEADTFLRENEELRGVINAGHRRGQRVIRCVGDDHTPTPFDTFGPLAIAAIGFVQGTIEDRSITIRLQRRSSNDPVEDLPRRDRDGRAAQLRQQLLRWALDHESAIAESSPMRVEGIHDRASDNWETLLACASQISPRVEALAREYALRMSLQDTDESETSLRTMLLVDLRKFFESHEGRPARSQTIVEWLLEIEERPWLELTKGRPITVRGLAKLLRPFGIEPTQFRDEYGTNFRGYRREDFEDAFSRYLPNCSGRGPVASATDQPSLDLGSPGRPDREGS